MWGCTSTLTALRGGSQDHLFEEMRTEIADLRHALHGTEMEVKLLEERLENQDAKKSSAGHEDTVSLQRKVTALEKTIDKMSNDLKSLMAYANQTTSSLAQYRDHIQEIDRKINEVAKLRSALTTISKTYSSSEGQTYRVKSGDSLEKVARKFNVSVEALKKDNRLSSDKIVIGQDLTIPNNE
jgi:LysM repeat protein